MFPVCEFQHFDEYFHPDTPVADDHPMVLARPDLFAPVKPRKPKPTKE